MAKQILHDAEVGSAREQMRGEAVAEHVRVHVAQSGEGGVLLDELPDRDPFERAAGPGEQQATI